MLLDLLFGKRLNRYITDYIRNKHVNEQIDRAILQRIEEWKSRYPRDNFHIGEMFDIGSVIASRKHKQLNDVAAALKCSNVLMVGPPGSGKTTIARDIARMWRHQFYYTGGVQNEYKLLGFKDASGRYQPTPFYKAYKEGGIFLFDEVDSSVAQALVAFNTALDNDLADFPDGEHMTPKSKSFFCLAAANTYGRDGEFVFHGRNPLDPTTLDRFTIIKIDYDNDLELANSIDPEWTKKVQLYRAAAATEVPDHFISMRASFVGGKLKKLGIYSDDEILDMVVWRGLNSEKILKIMGKANILKGRLGK